MILGRNNIEGQYEHAYGELRLGIFFRHLGLSGVPLLNFAPTTDCSPCPQEFLAIDIALAVTLNKLSLLGFAKRFWATEGSKRPCLHRFLVSAQGRPHFPKAVTVAGSPDGARVQGRKQESKRDQRGSRKQEYIRNVAM